MKAPKIKVNFVPVASKKHRWDGHENLTHPRSHIYLPKRKAAQAKKPGITTRHTAAGFDFQNAFLSSQDTQDDPEAQLRHSKCRAHDPGV